MRRCRFAGLSVPVAVGYGGLRFSTAEARPRAVACAKERYERLIKSAGRAMVGESKLAMEDLVGDLERP